MPPRSTRKTKITKQTTKKKKSLAKKKSIPKKKSTRKNSTNHSGSNFISRYLKNISWGYLSLILLVVTLGYVIYLDFTVQKQFDGKRWALPAKVFARPLELYNGLKLSENNFLKELEMLFPSLSCCKVQFL